MCDRFYFRWYLCHTVCRRRLAILYELRCDGDERREDITSIPLLYPRLNLPRWRKSRDGTNLILDAAYPVTLLPQITNNIFWLSYRSIEKGWIYWGRIEEMSKGYLVSKRMEEKMHHGHILHCRTFFETQYTKRKLVLCMDEPSLYRAPQIIKSIPKSESFPWELVHWT